MHHPPDLNLASSYIPACFCLMKAVLIFLLFILSPVKGWIGICCLLCVDRIIWNNAFHVAILDVNAILVALAGGLMIMHTRIDGVRGILGFSVIWMLVNACQIVGITRLKRTYEVIFGACFVTVMSCLYQSSERVELLALRSFIFVVFNISLPYLGLMMQQPEIDSYANVARTFLFFMGEPEAAFAWLVIYILCLGYQIRASVRRNGCESVLPVQAIKTSQQMHVEVVQEEDETSMLRELLAAKKKSSD